MRIRREVSYRIHGICWERIRLQYLNYDSECTKKIPGLELMDLFYTGLFIADKGRMYRPSYMEAAALDSVSIHVVSEDTAGVITIAYYAAEHTPESN